MTQMGEREFIRDLVARYRFAISRSYQNVYRVSEDGQKELVYLRDTLARQLNINAEELQIMFETVYAP